MSESTKTPATLSLTPGMKKWILVSMILAAIGTAVTIYSTVHHVAVKTQGQTDMACNINDTFSCDDVALSKYSEIGGVPLGIFGLGYFVALLILLGLGYAGGKTAKEHLHAYAAMTLIGIVTSVVLFGISYFQVGALCLSCMGIYAVTLLQVINLGVFKSELPGSFDPKETFSGLTTGAIGVALVVAVYMFTDPVGGKKTTAEQPVDPALPTVADVTQDIPIAKNAYSGLGEDYRSGPENARVVVQEFADFQCPACRTVASVVSQLKSEYQGKVLFVFRNYPLDQSCNPSINRKMHPFACSAAVMARCAGQKGKFWEAHDLIFANQSSLSDANLKLWAKQLGVSEEQYDVCQQADEIKEKIKDDIKLGGQIGVDATPSLYINGRKYLGNKSYVALKAELEKQLAN